MEKSDVERARLLAEELFILRNVWLQSLRAHERGGKLIEWLTTNVASSFNCLPKESREGLCKTAEAILTRLNAQCH